MPAKPKILKINKEQMSKLYKAGWTDAQVADFYDVTIDSIYKWKVKYPEFKQQVSDWKVEADERVEKALYNRALGYSHTEENIVVIKGEVKIVKTTKCYPPDTAACFIWLKNRKEKEWRDKPIADDEGYINEEIEFKDVPLNGDGLNRFSKFVN